MEEEIARVILVFSLFVVSSYAARGIAQAEECPLGTVAKNDSEGCKCAQSDQQIVRRKNFSLHDCRFRYESSSGRLSLQ